MAREPLPSLATAVPAPLTKSEALTLAAWLVAVTGERAVFLEMLDAIEAT